MSYRSTALIIILVFGVLLSMIYFSNSDVITSNKKKLIQELQTARGDSYVVRMIKPENICFAIDQAILDKYPSFVQSINEADRDAEADIKANNRYGNYYTGVGLDLPRAQMLSLLRAYEGFNETVSHTPTPDNLFTYQNRYFSCGFNYAQKYYQVDLRFTTLEQVNRSEGYVPIHITAALAEKKEGDLQVPSGATFAPFNNTIVFFNELTSPVTVEVINRNESMDEGRLESITIPASKMSDFRLAANWSSLDNTIYHYKVREYPWIEGDISVSIRYTIECMDREIAKSLYYQSDFEVNFPSYLPDGFKPACNAENTGDYLIQIYVNQSAVDYYKNTGIMHSRDNPYPFYLYTSTPEEEAKGIFQIHAQKSYFEEETPRKQLQANYESMLNATSRFVANPQLFEINGTSYLTFNQGRLSVVDVAMDYEYYRLIGTLPVDEMIRIANSLS